MKTAILISGAMRSFDRCLPNLAWMIFRHFPDADFYVSTEPDEDADKAELLRAKYPKARVEIDRTPQPDMQPLLDELHANGFVPANWTPGQNYTHEPYFISVSPLAVLGQLWRLQRAWDFFSTGEPYDIIIRCRPDLWIQSANGLREVIFDESALVPWWGRFGGVNDRFAILGVKAASAYFRTFSRLADLLGEGCPLHPESLIRASLEADGCDIGDHLRVEFSTLRKNGKMRPPEILAQDIAHAALRL